MKAVIFSDSHRSFSPMMKAMERETGVSMIIHAGDVLSDAEDLVLMYPDKNVVYVKGNNDWFDRSGAVEDRFFTFDGVKIFLTHGHNYGVKYSSAKVRLHGRELGADICIFGHTHSRYHEETDSIVLFNPGSAVFSYGVLITDGSGGFTLEIKEI